jgi:hypothetical protein
MRLLLLLHFFLRHFNFRVGPVGTAVGFDGKEISRIDTHWKQTLFFLNTPLQLERGDVVRGNLTAVRRKVVAREYDVSVSYGVVKAADPEAAPQMHVQDYIIE